MFIVKNDIVKAEQTRIKCIIEEFRCKSL